jgi:CHAT domain-containing protein
VDKFPAGHSDLATSLNNMGFMLQALGRYEQSVDCLERALAMKRRLTDTLVLVASEGEAHALARVALSSLSLYLSGTQHLAGSASSAYAHVWSERSALTTTLTQRLQAARLAAAGNPRTRQCFQELQDKRRALAHLLQQPLPQNGDALRERDRLVNELTQAKDALERQLLRLLPDLAKQHQSNKLSPDELRKDLPDHAFFIDLLRYDRLEFDPRKPGREGTRWVPCYVAFVVSRDQPTERIEVGKAEPIEAALQEWLHLIEQRKEHESPRVAEKLRRLLWEPIAEHLPKDTRTVYLAPDSGLSRLPWSALPGSKPGTILLEDHALALVPNGHFLLGQLRSEMRFGKGAGTPLVVGGIWKDLPGTERELRLLQTLYGDKALALEGRAADVSRVVKELPQARLVHLATHGFFNEKDFQREKKRASEQTTALLASREILAGPAGLRITAGAKSPLAYTGLLLAGADAPKKAGPDGAILTGEAIASLDLSRLELAVLSACQTGLGEVADRECVFNLQYAFHLAGCSNVVASLWSVPDEPTAALMALFYRELQAGKSPLEALRAAQLYLYRHPGQVTALARERLNIAKGGKLPEPKSEPQPMSERKNAAVKDWAGFVLSGLGR